jgi:hypothetical protein
MTAAPDLFYRDNARLRARARDPQPKVVACEVPA